MVRQNRKSANLEDRNLVANQPVSRHHSPARCPQAEMTGVYLRLLGSVLLLHFSRAQEVPRGDVIPDSWTFYKFYMGLPLTPEEPPQYPAPIYARQQKNQSPEARRWAMQLSNKLRKSAAKLEEERLKFEKTVRKSGIEMKNKFDNMRKKMEARHEKIRIGFAKFMPYGQQNVKQEKKTLEAQRVTSSTTTSTEPPVALPLQNADVVDRKEPERSALVEARTIRVSPTGEFVEI
ncbi:unnamed protein product [Caenorhabditis auriculariae]|uniref:Uncharacterized protein n=1 Tax=Caenorhabditis auriculariae TaxID=2777116 RepID=A0A8S1GZG6_9PELO|nr:unnamed protein product [Caenorhabditis auriculariae]